MMTHFISHKWPLETQQGHEAAKYPQKTEISINSDSYELIESIGKFLYGTGPKLSVFVIQ
jgi:hypothetical protein